MFQPAPGVSIPAPEWIPEQFEVYEGKAVRANISFEKLGPFVHDFYHMLPEPLFFVMHLPLSRSEEFRLGWQWEGRFHQEVLYLDGQSQKQIDAIMRNYGPLLLADGISQFAVASHKSAEEIFVQKYKLTELFSPQPRRFLPLLRQYGLSESAGLTTVWDTFSQEQPGECRRVLMEGLDVYQVANLLKEQGMYRAKIIPDD
jgi:hypothetical protein